MLIQANWVRTGTQHIDPTARRAGLERLNGTRDTISCMEELKKLRESNLITEEEFMEKRAEIIKDL
jgi:hypothetical protein